MGIFANDKSNRVKFIIGILLLLLLAGCSAQAGNPSDTSSTTSEQAASAVSAPSETASASLEGSTLADGDYTIEVKTDSNMFHPTACTLHVQDGQMTASLTLPGEGFSRLHFGTSEEAETASDTDIYDYYLDDEGKYTFDVPVTALEKELPIAAWGQRRDRWYDHTIIFHAP